MRLNNYLNEVKDYILENGPPVWRILLKDCKSFLKELEKTKLSPSRWVFRGTKRIRSDKGIEEIIPRRDRYPKDMPPELHNKYDEEFHRKFRWNPRSEGVFTTGKFSTAGTYGQANLVFPIGKYRYIWSPEIDDLYSYSDGEGLLDYGEGYYEDYFDSYVEDEYEQEFGEGSGNGHWEYDGDEVGRSNYNRWEVAAEISDDIEEDFFDEGLLEWIPDETLDYFVDQKREEKEAEVENKIDWAVNTYISKDLKAGLKSGHEIMFDCDSYYIVSVRFADFLGKMIHDGVYQLKLPFPPFGETTKPKYWVYNKKGNIVYNDPIK